MDMTLAILSGLFGFVGAVIGGRYSLYAAEQSHRHQIQLQEQERRDQVRRLLQALYDEVSLAWDAYTATGGKLFEQLAPGQLFRVYTFTQSFPVFEQNAGRLGDIEDSELRRALVRTFTQGKALMDAFVLNNQMLIEHDRTAAYVNVSEENRSAHQISRQNLDSLTANLKQLHFQVKKDVEGLLDLLAKAGVVTTR